MNINATLSRVDAADIATDRGAGEEAIITSIEGEDPSIGRMIDDDLRLAAALLELVRKLVVPKQALMSAQRFLGLVLHLAPDVLGLSQNAAAKQLKISRAGLSKHSNLIASSWNLGHARWRKRSHMSETYRRAQLRAVAKGSHAAFKRKDLKKKKMFNGAADQLTPKQGYENKTYPRKTQFEHARPPIQRVSQPEHDSEMVSG